MSAAFLMSLALFAVILRAARPAPEASGGASRILILSAASLLAVAALNYLVNPFGLFAPRLFEPIVLHSRADKLRLLARGPAPAIVILGSSPTFTLPPAYILQETGLTAFNASVHGASPRDYWALLRYMLSRRIVPKAVIVALSFEQFRPGARVGFEPHDPLGPYLSPSGAPSPLADARSLLTLEQTGASLRALSAALRGPTEPFYRFDPDGLGHFARRTDLDAALAEATRALPNLRFEDLDPSQWGHLQALLEECRRRGIRVIVYLPPYHPRLTELWEARTSLVPIRELILRRLAPYRPAPLVGAHDLTHVESFGGTEALFHDTRHPDEEANRLMLDVLLRDLG